MYTDPSARLISRFYDAVLAPSRWKDALDVIASQLGAAGVNFGIWTKPDNKVEWFRTSGPLTGVQADYARYYNDCDPFRPILDAAPRRTWVQMTRSLDADVISRNAFCKEFLRDNGIGDLIGIRLCDTPSHVAYFGVHREPDRPPLSEKDLALLDAIIEPLTLATRLRLDLHRYTWQPRLARHMLEHVPAPAIVAASDGRVVEVNPAAERILARGDGLEIRDGLLAALGKRDDAALMRCVYTTAVNDGTTGVMRSMVVRRRSGAPSYTLTVAPLAVNAEAYSHRLALILITDPDDPPTQEVRRLEEVPGHEEEVAPAPPNPLQSETPVSTERRSLRATRGLLTSREHDVLLALKHGLSNSEIAQSLCLSGKTIEFHLTNIMKKLEAPNRTSALVVAIQRGYFEI